MADGVLGRVDLLGLDEGLAVVLADVSSMVICFYIHSTSLVCRSLLSSLVVSHFN